jgi:hypothetical protein
MAFERVTVVPTGLEADMVCALLRTEGIDCFSRETDYSVGALPGGPYEVVVVRSDDLPRARELVGARS